MCGMARDSEAGADVVGETAGGPRVASVEDAALVTKILVGAFYDDPTWSWVFPDAAQRRAQHAELWRLFVDGALRYPWVWLDSRGVATSVWTPPGGTELPEEQEASLDTMLVRLLGPGAGRALRTFELFDQAHPRNEPHYYLSLLGTDPARRGHGYGLALLASNLRLVDQAGAPAYLEASNPANVPLYERYGFRAIGSFALPEDGPTVYTMWRAPTGDPAHS